MKYEEYIKFLNSVYKLAKPKPRQNPPMVIREIKL
jgi:hypothetical protein